jgi:hypothetical protein
MNSSTPIHNFLLTICGIVILLLHRGSGLTPVEVPSANSTRDKNGYTVVKANIYDVGQHPYIALSLSLTPLYCFEPQFDLFSFYKIAFHRQDSTKSPNIEKYVS